MDIPVRFSESTTHLLRRQRAGRAEGLEPRLALLGGLVRQQRLHGAPLVYAVLLYRLSENLVLLHRPVLLEIVTPGRVHWSGKNLYPQKPVNRISHNNILRVPLLQKQRPRQRRGGHKHADEDADDRLRQLATRLRHTL